MKILVYNQKGASMRYGDKLNTHYLYPSLPNSLPPSKRHLPPAIIYHIQIEAASHRTASLLAIVRQ